jgi:hypothetical protein
MDRVLVKNIIILSIFLGVILGLLSPIPHVGIFMLMAVFLLSAPLIMVYLIMDGRLDLTTTQDSIIQGALAGFVSGFSFSVTYAVLMFFLGKIFHYSSNFILTTMISNCPIWLLLVFIIFIGVVFATTNAFSGFLTYYIINLMRDMYEKRR